MGEVCLNALPLKIDADPGTVVGRVWMRDDKFDEELHDRPEQGEEFQHYSLMKFSYVWALPGGKLPSDCVSRGRLLKLAEVPARILAYAAKRAAARHLEAQGFETRRAPMGQALSLLRRNTNLAEKLISTSLPNTVGAFPGLKVQGFALSGNDTEPGPVALIVDQYVAHVLEVPLKVLADNGVEYEGARVRWRHSAACSCNGDGGVGDAGRVIGGNVSGDLLVRDPAGNDLSLPAECLAVHANRTMLTRYLAGLGNTPQQTISEGLYAAANEQAKTSKRWTNLNGVSKQLFGDLELFSGVTATVEPPIVAPAGAKPSANGPVALPAVAEGTLNFQFGTPKLAKQATTGLKEHGPYDMGQQRNDVLKAVVVAPAAFEADAKKLRDILTQGLKTFKGFKTRYKLRSFECDIQTFAQPTRSGYEHAMSAAAKTGVDIVFFIIRADFRYARRGENPYLAAKAVLASIGLASQAVTVETLHQADNSLQWSSDSVGLAAYTKLGNVPFVLHDPDGARELVLGVGRSDVYDPAKGNRRQIFGSSVAVRQDGDFLFAGSTTGVSDDEEYQEHLERLLKDNIKRYEETQGQLPQRLVIYLFKRTGKREREAIEAALGNRSIDYALLHINRDSPLWLVERRAANQVLPPQRGLTVALRDNDRLLVTADPKKVGSHPLRLELDQHSTFTDMDRLVHQAFGFTKTNYRGFLQSNEPSPLRFGRLLAEKVEQLVPYNFNPATATGPFGDRPWFI